MTGLFAGRRRILVTFAAFWAFAATAAFAQATGQGWIVLSLARMTGITTVQLDFREKATDTKHYAGFTIGLFNSNQQDWDEGRIGEVKVMAVPAGAYRLSAFRLEDSMSKRAWNSRQDFDKPFEVRPGEVTYLGEFVGTGILSKPFFGTRAVEKPYFLVTDQQARDMPLALKQKPEIQGLPVRSLAPFVVKGGPDVFLTKRLPDRE